MHSSQVTTTCTNGKRFQSSISWLNAVQTHLGLIQLALPFLVEALVLVAPVSEGAHCAHIKVILTHAHARLTNLAGWLV